MWNFLEKLLPKPPTSDQELWRLVSRGLAFDAGMLANGLEAARRPAAGNWTTMLIECEIAGLRAWSMCGILCGGQQTAGEAMIKNFELRFREWLELKRKRPLAAYCVFSRTTLADSLTELSGLGRNYEAIALADAKVSPETLLNLIALFWGRCVERYTNRKLETFLGQASAKIDQFIPRYVSMQIQLAVASRPTSPSG